MKKIFQIVLVYTLGILCVISLVWRASSLDKKYSLASNNTDEVYVYNK